MLLERGKLYLIEWLGRDGILERMRKIIEM